ncbi:MAG: Xaa-Pro peptidase family protein [Spirochaetes bacterium]|nr:Xaa-Pro peptidase family protein [Spirochaetota bacterium]MBU0955885.1 Xaa-Pro peptidase family protein [Spirochaetota bacterium]
MDAFLQRRKLLAEDLTRRGLALAMFEDTEGRRDISIRYFTGHPGDALLFINADGRAALVAWDVNMANNMASVDQIFAYTDFGRSAYDAMDGMIKHFGIPAGGKIDLPTATPYLSFIEYVDRCPDYDFACTENNSSDKALAMRAVKDAAELDIYHKVSAITDSVMDAIEAGVKNGSLKSESDVALFIERALREQDCEATGFDTIAAGPSRSFGIHAFPSYSGAAFGSEGMSILDFGLVYKGYTSDVTMTFIRGKLEGKRAEMVALVQQAYTEAVALCKPGLPSRAVAQHVDELFRKHGYTMPHGLGHGVGLEAHEMPPVNLRESNTWILEPGHIITIEPGLYDPELGGVRLENDVLITADGYEVLTHSRIVQL